MDCAKSESPTCLCGVRRDRDGALRDLLPAAMVVPVESRRASLDMDGRGRPSPRGFSVR